MEFLHPLYVDLSGLSLQAPAGFDSALIQIIRLCDGLLAAIAKDPPAAFKTRCRRRLGCHN